VAYRECSEVTHLSSCFKSIKRDSSSSGERGWISLDSYAIIRLNTKPKRVQVLCGVRVCAVFRLEYGRFA